MSGGAVEEINSPGFDYSGSGPEHARDLRPALVKADSDADVALTGSPGRPYYRLVEQMLAPAGDRHPTDIAPIIPAVA